MPLEVFIDRHAYESHLEEGTPPFTVGETVIGYSGPLEVKIKILHCKRLGSTCGMRPGLNRSLRIKVRPTPHENDSRIPRCMRCQCHLVRVSDTSLACKSRWGCGSYTTDAARGMAPRLTVDEARGHR